MQQFIRGQRAKISAFSGRTSQFYLQITLSSARVRVFDFVCFGVDSRGQLSDDRYMTFFNQRRSPSGEIVLEDLADQDAKFEFDLGAVPAHIERLVFTVSVDGAGAMRDLDESFLVLGERGIPFGQPLLQYRFSGADFEIEGALMLAEIYRKDGEWRFWAQGQGFKGDLSALLRHFGGQETEENSASTASVSTPSVPTASSPISAPTVPIGAPPSPPISAPATGSIVVTPPAPVVSSAPSALQKAIADAAPGSTLTLQRGEFAGPLLIDKPLVLDGNGAVIWAQNGPVVRVSVAGVTLKNLEIEATAPENFDDADVALWIDAGAQTVLHHVRARGEIRGVAGAEGQWRLPPALNLGEFAARQTNSFRLEIEVPHACEIKSTVAGVSPVPARLEAGRREIELATIGIGADTFLAGQLEILAGGVARTVPISGRATNEAAPAQGILLWCVDR